jgi:hypothetical protein
LDAVLAIAITVLDYLQRVGGMVPHPSSMRMYNIADMTFNPPAAVDGEFHVYLHPRLPFSRLPAKPSAFRTPVSPLPSYERTFHLVFSDTGTLLS